MTDGWADERQWMDICGQMLVDGRGWMDKILDSQNRTSERWMKVERTSDEGQIDVERRLHGNQTKVEQMSY